MLTHTTYQKMKESTDIQPLQPSVVKLKAYTGEVIPVLGQVTVSVFKRGLGCLQGAKVKLFVKSDVLPNFFKARTVPLALRKKVEDELDCLQGEGIISPVKFS